MPDEHRQLDQRERVPRRLWASLDPVGEAPLRGPRGNGWGSRLRAPAALALVRRHGQPEDTVTRHQPVSTPTGPSRGRTAYTVHPGSPSSSLEICAPL